MADITLTTGDNSLNGTGGDDLFSGPAGGTDTLRGLGGADVFQIEGSEAGSIDGGSGLDTVQAIDFDLGTLSFARVETLDIASGGLSATADQLASFSTIMSSSGNSDVNISLTGDGGAVNFGATWTGAQLLHIDGFGAAGGFTLTGTANTDFIAGSDFTDTISGRGGDDHLTGRGGTGDILYGDGGDDSISNYSGGASLYGGSGKDTIFAYSDDSVYGGGGNDKIHVKFGTNTIDGGAGSDHCRLGLGSDTLVFTDGSDSSLHAPDWVFHFDSAADKIDVAATIDGVDATVEAASRGAIGGLDGTELGAGHAVLVDVGSHTFLAVDLNGVAGFQGGSDLVVRVDGVTNIDVSNFI